MNHEVQGVSNNVDLNFKIVSTIRRRRSFLLSVRGLAICIVTAAVLLLGIGLAAHYYRHHNTVLNLLRIGALLGILGSIILFLVQPLRKRITDVQLARLVEERNPSLGDRLVTSVEMTDQNVRQQSSPAIVDRLLADTKRQVDLVDVNNVISRQRLLTYSAAGIGAILLFTGVLLFGLGQFPAVWRNC